MGRSGQRPGTISTRRQQTESSVWERISMHRLTGFPTFFKDGQTVRALVAIKQNAMSSSRWKRRARKRL